MNDKSEISTENDSYRKYVEVRGVPMAYVDVGHGDPIARFIASVLAEERDAAYAEDAA